MFSIDVLLRNHCKIQIIDFLGCKQVAGMRGAHRPPPTCRWCMCMCTPSIGGQFSREFGVHVACCLLRVAQPSTTTRQDRDSPTPKETRERERERTRRRPIHAGGVRAELPQKVQQNNDREHHVFVVVANFNAALKGTEGKRSKKENGYTQGTTLNTQAHIH